MPAGAKDQPSSLADLSATRLVELLRGGEASPTEALDAVLARIEQVDPSIHAVVTLAAEQAYDTARSLGPPPLDHTLPLWGVPVTVKDITPTHGIRTTRGSRLTRRWGPDHDAVAVERLRAAGAVIVAKTNTSEDGWKAETSNPMFPSTVNPWDTSRTPGGSSGGAAAAVACGFGPIATGTDGAGSVRIPAAFCGVVGFKPSFGAIPYWPPSAEQLSHFGPLGRTVEDVGTTFGVLAGPDRRDPTSWWADRPGEVCDRPLRIGVLRSAGSLIVEPEILAAVDRVADDCAGLGHRLVALPALSDPYDALEVILSAFEAASYCFDGDLESDAPDLDPGRVAVIRRGLGLGAGDLAGAVERRASFAIEAAGLWRDLDIVLSPSTPVLAFEPGRCGPSGTDELVGRLAWATFSYPWNLTGDPACSLPAGLSTTGLPIGVQLVAPKGLDLQLLALAQQMQDASIIGYTPPPIWELV